MSKRRECFTNFHAVLAQGRRSSPVYLRGFTVCAAGASTAVSLEAGEGLRGAKQLVEAGRCGARRLVRVGLLLPRRPCRGEPRGQRETLASVTEDTLLRMVRREVLSAARQSREAEADR